MSEATTHRGVIVTAAGTGVNLALGVLYAWSVIKSAIPDSWEWTNANKALPYSVACLMFALAMIPAGRLQDKIGPRWVATLGGVFAGAGCVVAGLCGSSLTGFVLGFGMLGGIGIGFGYAAATPPAVKWFPPHRTGLIAGIVVAGFGLASVYIAPLASWLLAEFAGTTTGGTIEKGVSQTMIIFGGAFLIMVTALAQLIKDPPPGYVAHGTAKSAPLTVNVPWCEMLKTAQFYVLWIMYFAGAAAGLTFISVAQNLGKQSLGELAFVAVVVLAIGNAGGRVLAGFVSDRLGRQTTLCTVFLLQALIVAALFFARTSGMWPLLLAILVVIGGNYGANLSLFPSASKDYFGLKGFGLNYGILFTAWGSAGLIMPWVNGRIADVTGSEDWTYAIIIALLLAAAALTFVSRRLGTSPILASPAFAPDSSLREKSA